MSQNDTSKKRGRGRPSIPNEDKKNYTISFRARGNIKESLEFMASKSGRSVSEEVEYILFINLPNIGHTNLPDNFLPQIPKELSEDLRKSYAQVELFINLGKACTQSNFQFLVSRLTAGYQDDETRQAIDEVLAKIEETKKFVSRKRDIAVENFNKIGRDAEDYYTNLDNKKKKWNE